MDKKTIRMDDIINFDEDFDESKYYDYDKDKTSKDHESGEHESEEIFDGSFEFEVEDECDEDSKESEVYYSECSYLCKNDDFCYKEEKCDCDECEEDDSWICEEFEEEKHHDCKCEKEYERGYNAGYDCGFTDGYEKAKQEVLDYIKARKKKFRYCNY